MRLAGEIKLGYYPTPQSIADILAHGFIPPVPSAPWTALDPFCGTGEALAAFGAPLSFGSDLDAERLAAAASHLTETLQADAWALKPRKRSTSLLLLNPPYTQDHFSREREEIRAVHTFVPWVHPKGWVVLMVPRTIVFTYRSALDAALTLRALWRFPDPAYAAFGQIVLIGQPRQSADPPNDWRRWLTTDAPPERPTQDEHWEDFRQPSWPRPLPVALDPQWRLPSTLGYHLVATRPRPDQVVPLLAHTTAWETLRLQTAPPATLDLEDPIHTPLTLHRGHLATLLTAGRLTGAIGTGDQRHLVRGRTIPYTVTTAETKDQRVEETRYRIEITTVHPDGTIQRWHEHEASPDLDGELDAETDASA